MAKKMKSRAAEEFAFFDVVYADGARSSRRRVSVAGLMRDEVEAHAKTEIMAQDRRIAEMSGNDRGPIQSLTRSA